MTKHLFTIIYRREMDGKEIEIEEHIVSESWQAALAYWKPEIDEQRVKSIHCQVPVLTTDPKPRH